MSRYAATVAGTHYAFSDMRELLAKASPLRSGDQLARVAAADARERGHWKDYMEAYEDAIRETATPESPWYVVPADNKWFTRAVVAAAVIKSLASLDLCYPRPDAAKRRELERARRELLNEG